MMLGRNGNEDEKLASKPARRSTAPTTDRKGRPEMINNTTLERSNAPEETAVNRAIATFKAAVKVPLVLVAVALPIALATPAHAMPGQATPASINAASASSGCTLKKVWNPAAGGRDFFTGRKLVKYEVTVNCLSPAYVQVQQRWYEHDSTVDELIGKKTSYWGPVWGDYTFSVTEALPDTEGSSEEMWQKARFWAVDHLPAPADIAYGPWKYSGVTSLSN
jgi:hypothetical protein